MQHLQPQFCQHTFVVLLLLFSLPGKGADKGPTAGYDLSAQQSVSVTSGLCVEIPCKFTFSSQRTLSTSVTGIWKRKETPDIVVASTDASKVSERTKGRFNLTGKVHKRDCSFSISNAQPEDQGEYEFRLEDGDIKYSYIWNKLSVTVTNVMEPTISPVRNLIAGKQITLTCMSHPTSQGCKGNITWEGRINTENTYNYERKDQAGKVSSMSDLTFTPSQRDHNSSLTCTVTYSGVSAKKTITLDVEYPPSMTITIPGYNGTYENKSVTMIDGDLRHVPCEVSSNPVADISWRRGNEILNSTPGQSLTLALEKVSVANGVTYKCLAQNTHGSITATVTINVEYAPKSPTILSCTSACMNCTSAGCRVEVIEGTSLSLLCSAESNPPANLYWAKQNSTEPLNSLSGRLEVSNVTTDNEGDYMCQASNEHGNSTTPLTVVTIYAPKRLTIKYCKINDCSVYENSSVEVFEGNSFYLQCDAVSNPLANLSWIKHTKNSTVIQNSPILHLNMTKSPFENVVNYTCRAMNIVGNESKSIFVVIKSPTNDVFHLVGPFCGIVVLLLTVIVAAVMVKRYKKRRRPAEQAEEYKSSTPNTSEVVYSNIEKRTFDQKPNTSLSSPNESKNIEEDLQYVTLDFSSSKQNRSPEPQETLYSEVKRN